MADELPPLKFNHILNYEKDRRSTLTEPPPKPASSMPWSANLPMNEERAQRMRTALARHSTDPELLRAYDNEMKDANYQPPADETIAKDMKASGLHQTTAASYNPELATSGLSEEAQGRVRSELNQMVSELKFQPGLGAHLTERLAEIGPRYQKWSEAERSAWESKQASLLEKLSGGAGKVPEVRELAKAALRRASGNFPKNLAASALMNDAFLVLSLAHQERYHAAYENLRRRRR